MKRLRLLLQELSLTQQLTTIVFIVVLSLTVFIFSYLSPGLDEVTGYEVNRILYYAQESMLMILNIDSIDAEHLQFEQRDISQILYNNDVDTYTVLGNGKVDQDDIYAINQYIEQTDDQQMFKNPVTFKMNRNTYVISEVKPNQYLISFTSSEMQDSLNHILSTSLINFNILISVVLFVILTVWVVTIIYPLNQIKNYITKIKNDEPAILNISRRDEIGEVADALRDMEDELQKQNREKQEMIQNISHDLKTPIATIKSYGEAIKDGIYPYGTLEKSIDVIVEHADRLEKKVRSLIALNKMEYLLDDCAPGDNLNMNDVIDKVFLSLKVIRPEISFESNMDRNVMFHGDEDPWQIVIENLVDNALRYARTTIRIELHPGELSVINDGSSISMDRLEKLFKPYEKGTDGKFGLGLSIVYRIVTTYGYHVAAENLADGVCFRIWKELPKKELRAIEKEKKREEKDNKKK